MSTQGQESHAAEKWKRKLGLIPMEGESGWWQSIYESSNKRDAGGIADRACSAIYYLLDAAKPTNYWHWLASDDIHVLIDGGPVDYYTVSNGRPARQTLGRNTSRGQKPVIAIPGGSYKALRLAKPHSFALMASIVAPAWDLRSLHIGPPVNLPETQALRQAGLTPELIRSLTAPRTTTYP